LIWQTAYSEFFTSNALWPDFDVLEFSKALIEFSKRKRRFGVD
jgi:undecaprenyl diphosphate synthase